MHKEILSKEQVELLPLLKLFSKDFGLVGGTAIALQVGHRSSIDFDLFTDRQFSNLRIRNIIQKNIKINNVIVDKSDEFTILFGKVKFTFFHYPYKISYSKKIDHTIKMPDLLTLAAMKAFSLGRRAKWKDYVDLFFIIKDYFSIEEIIKRAKKIFGNEFNEKIFRVQLSYFKDIDFSEKIIWLKNYETKDSFIKKELIKFSLS